MDRITWSTAKNANIVNATHRPKLTGYIKDSAWDYEKEIRLKATFENTKGFERVAIDIPDNVLDAMIITAGPLFNGNLTMVRSWIAVSTGYSRCRSRISCMWRR